MGFLQKVINKVIKAIEISELAKKAITLNIGQKEFVKNYIRMLDVFSKDIIEIEKENQLSFEYGVGRMAMFYLFLCRYIKKRFKFPIRDVNIDHILSLFEKKYIESAGMFLFATYGRSGSIELFKVRLKSYSSSQVDGELLVNKLCAMFYFHLEKAMSSYEPMLNPVNQMFMHINLNESTDEQWKFCSDITQHLNRLARETIYKYENLGSKEENKGITFTHSSEPF